MNNNLIEQTGGVNKPFLKLREDYSSFSSDDFLWIVGPCSIESLDQIKQVAIFLKQKGVKVLRAGAWKPRTSAKSFQGLGLQGLKILREIADTYGFLICSELLSEQDLQEAAPLLDIIQIGTRNAQNYRLLEACGDTGKPILYKRGQAQLIEEFVAATEYISKNGNNKIFLCERGIRTFETITRYTLDLGAVAVLKTLVDYPVIVDPSHAAGRRAFVPAFTRAAVAMGADGLLLEVHPNPDQALSDASQQLDFQEFSSLAKEVDYLVSFMRKKFW